MSELNTKLNQTFYDDDNKLNEFCNVLQTLVCRAILVAVGAYCTYFLACVFDRYYLILLILFIFTSADTLWVCIKRKGFDFDWFTPSYLVLSIQALTAIYIVSKKNYELGSVNCQNNATQFKFKAKYSYCAIFNDYSCTILKIFICLYLVAQILARRFTPTKLNRIQQSNLLVAFLSAAADVVDFTDYNASITFTNFLGGVNLIWVITLISSFQFAFVLNSIKQVDKNNKQSFNDFLFGTEVWSLILVLFTQDLPYLIIRILFLTKFGVDSIATLFFLLKNFLMILEDLRRISIAYFEYKEHLEQINPM